ncbi:MAG TPA: hypothetical protein VGP06_11695 [Janthinobacterium sp.]|jgi:hypothetical protein|nr:hypothetical protein [Janthinobacterium sp.]
MMTFKKSVLCFAAMAVLTACASKRQGSVTFPEVGVVTTKGLGESLILRGSGVVRPVLVTLKDQAIGATDLPKGRYVSNSENSEWIRFASVEKNDTSGKTAKAIIYLNKKDRTICAGKESCVTLEYTLDSVISNPSAKEFQQTLLYSGKVGNRVTLSYREFFGKQAMPAFTNSVDYDLSESQILGYKGARIEVIQATNAEITYKLLSGFE